MEGQGRILRALESAHGTSPRLKKPTWSLGPSWWADRARKERKKEREKARLNESEMSPACIPQREQEIPFLAHVDLEWREMTRLI